METSNIVNNWLKEHGDVEIDRFIEMNLDIVNKVHTVLNERNLSKAELAKLMGKKPPEISKWLSGMHNLTLKSIVKMEVVLGVDLISVSDKYKK